GGLGCAADSAEPEDDVAVDEAALSSSLIQVLGTIAPGGSVSVPYTATPKYRAYSFTAAAGDKVTFKVTSESGGDAFAYILGSTFATIASNDNASATTKDAEVTATIKKSGTYYVALRNVVRAPTTFTLSFAGRPPAVSDSPGPACDGTLTSAGLAKLFSTKPAAGSGSAASAIALGSYTAKVYTRDCSSTAGGCSAWSENANATAPASAQNDILVPSLKFRAGYVVGSSGGGGIGLRLRSNVVESVDSGVPGYPCYHSLVGAADIATPSASKVAMGLQVHSTCSNDGSATVAFDTTVTDACMKAVKIMDTQRSDFGGGAYVAKQLAVVIDARY
ncbi:MAG TPA: PPC domain-containing protein, partial [Labilithrix sp.]|nr:PPC domain-containing protein [Labilithrix sp.]